MPPLPKAPALDKPPRCTPLGAPPACRKRRRPPMALPAEGAASLQCEAPWKKRLSVLGGGQLGKMLAQAAAQMGVQVTVLDSPEGCPASTVATQVVGSYRDQQAIRDFVERDGERGSVLTVEIEHVDLPEGVACTPSRDTLRLIQDKLLQKRHFQGAGVPVVEFAEVADEAGAREAARRFGFPFMLKSRRLAYDGRGNARVEGQGALAAQVEALGGYSQGLYAERWAPYEKELAVMVARSRGGQVESFPVTETRHRDSILLATLTPARLPPGVEAAARQLAEAAVQSLGDAGVFGVELFLLADGALLLNEVAPRPHNSGHYTIEACEASQFEQHLRAVLGWPLASPALRVGASMMLNILGEADGEEGQQRAETLLSSALQVPGVAVHWYGKSVARGRKVGHLTLTGASRGEVLGRLARLQGYAAREEVLAWAGAPPPLVGVIMGSDSDLPTMGAAAEVLERFGVPFEVTVVSAHRTPERLFQYARAAHQRGLKVIIAGAGGAAHLPGMVAALSPLPVVGVPVTPKGAHLDGMDALLSIAQMPRGVPVATVAVGNAANAGLLAVRMLGAGEPGLVAAMLAFQEEARQGVLEKAARLEERGWREYL